MSSVGPIVNNTEKDKVSNSGHKISLLNEASMGPRAEYNELKLLDYKVGSLAIIRDKAVLGHSVIILVSTKQ